MEHGMICLAILLIPNNIRSAKKLFRAPENMVEKHCIKSFLY